MSEDRFFNQVRETLHDYAPEVPQSVYGAMRRKLWWSNFTKLSVTRFNVWYAILIMAAGGIWFAGRFSQNKPGMAPAVVNEQTAIPKFKSFDTICAPKKAIGTKTDDTKSDVANAMTATKQSSAKAKRKVVNGNPVSTNAAEVKEDETTPQIVISEVPAIGVDEVIIPATESAEVTGANEAETEGQARTGTAFPVVILVDDSLNSNDEKKQN